MYVVGIVGFVGFVGIMRFFIVGFYKIVVGNT